MGLGDITITYSELTEIIQRTALETAKRTLEEAGLQKKTYSQYEIIQKYGRTIYRRSEKYVRWQKKGPHRTSPVICERWEFDQFLSKFDSELAKFKPKKTNGNSL